MRGLLYVRSACSQHDQILHVWMAYRMFFYFCRGRVIPADLEAKVIEAKQKVNVSSDNLHVASLTYSSPSIH